ncbi:MAG: SHOCT domain-containing protein [Clostridia bacterium]|nr:SHOCT domain-containing protein [Clostridia bacterium]
METSTLGRLYENVGKKIKALAAICFLLQSALFVLAGVIALIINFSDSHDDMFLYTLYALALIVLGPLYSWISSLALYGFGDLVDSCAQIKLNTQSDEEKAKIIEKKKTNEEAARRKKLDDLFISGMITAEEYQQKKNQN